MLNIKKKVATWYEQQPYFAKKYTEICLMLSLLFTFGLISSYHLFYTFQDTFLHFNFWRPLTAMLFLGKLDFTSLLSCCIMYIALRNMEQDKINKKSYPDFIWLIMVVFLACIVAGTFLDLYFLTEVFIISLLLICAYEKQSFALFGNVKLSTRTQTLFFSTGYGVAMAFVQKRLLTYIIGAAIGLIYILARDQLPKMVHKDYLQTPIWLKGWWVRSNKKQEESRD